MLWFSIEFSDYGATIVAYTLSVVLLLKLTATFRQLHFNFFLIKLLHNPLDFNF